ncbi:MAG: carbohydrate kinase family protein [Anaerolineae bacterium]|nr:carbohydrate kinase family protein [Anaerolineae bacterium]
MTRVLVSGLINIETTLRVDRFPIDYAPVRYPFWGVKTTVSGVGYNVAKALTVLGDDVHFVSLTGTDMYAPVIRETLRGDGIQDAWVLSAVDQTAQSVILYDGDGRRQINVDLKDIQDAAYPASVFTAALAGCDLAVLCNINFSRAFLATAKAHGVTIATDVHTISNLEDDYNRDFMAAADILFMSDEALPTFPEDWARAVMDRYNPRVLVIGLGQAGALLVTREPPGMVRVPTVATRPVVNTIGAGDALFSGFVHAYVHTRNAFAALRKATVFASYKIGVTGAAEGFLTSPELAAWVDKVKDQLRNEERRLQNLTGS